MTEQDIDNYAETIWDYHQLKQELSEFSTMYKFEYASFYDV